MATPQIEVSIDTETCGLVSAELVSGEFPELVELNGQLRRWLRAAALGGSSLEYPVQHEKYDHFKFGLTSRITKVVGDRTWWVYIFTGWGFYAKNPEPEGEPS